MAAKLGSLLIQSGVVTPEQLEEALQAQIMFGGRLGTNLVELGFVTEEALARALGKQYNMPFCAGEALINIPENARKLVPREMVLRKNAIPVRVNGRQLFVAMMDPSNIAAVDEISFATGYRVTPMIAPESQMMEALEKYYGVRRQAHALRPGAKPAAAESQASAEFQAEPAAAPPRTHLGSPPRSSKQRPPRTPCDGGRRYPSQAARLPLAADGSPRGRPFPSLG